MTEIITWLWADLWGASGSLSQWLAWIISIDAASVTLATIFMIFPRRRIRVITL